MLSLEEGVQDRIAALLRSELGQEVAVDVVDDRGRIDIKVRDYGGASRPYGGGETERSVTDGVRQVQRQTEDVREGIRSILESKFGEQVRVEFVRDGNRLDVRVTNLGVTDAVERRYDDVEATNYSELRFTVMFE